MTVFASAKEEEVDHTVFPEPGGPEPLPELAVPEPVEGSAKDCLRGPNGCRNAHFDKLASTSSAQAMNALRQACIDRLSTGNDHVSAGSTAAVEDVNDRLLTEICKDTGRVVS